MSAQTNSKLNPRKTFGPAGTPAGDQSAANNGNLQERVQSMAGLVNPLNLHIAGVVAVGLICVYLTIQVAVLWQTARNGNAEALDAQRDALKAAQIQARPLEGLDVKLTRSTEQADQFYRERLPISYSEVAEQLGTLAHRDNVRLTRVQYAPKAVMGETGQQLSEIQMDAALSGDYHSLITLINGLERDKQFFLIDNISLTGQQTGQVNLRIRMTTYLRGVPPVELEQKVSSDAADATGAQAELDAAQAGQARAAGGAR